MLFLFSHLWLAYVLSLVLMVVIILIVDHGGVDALIAAAVLELIPVLGLWCIRSEYQIPATVIAVLCCIAGLAAVLVLLAELLYLNPKMIAGGIAAAALIFLAVSESAKVFPGQSLQIFQFTACFGGMLSILFILWFLLELGEGMSSAG